MRKVEVQVALPGDVEPDVLAVPIPANGASLTDGLDERLRQRLQGLIDVRELRGELGQAIVLHTDDGRIAAAGIGPLDEVDGDAVRTAAAAVARAARDVGGTLAWLLDERLPLPLAEQ